MRTVLWCRCIVSDAYTSQEDIQKILGKERLTNFPRICKVLLPSQSQQPSVSASSYIGYIDRLISRFEGATSDSCGKGKYRCEYQVDYLNNFRDCSNAAYYETVYAVQKYLEDDGTLQYLEENRTLPEAVGYDLDLLPDVYPGAAQYGLNTRDGILIASILLKLYPVLVKRPVPLDSTFALHDKEDVELFTQFLHGKCYTPGNVQAAIENSNNMKRVMEHEATIHAHAVEMHIENISRHDAPAHIREVAILRSILNRLPSPIVSIEPRPPSTTTTS